MKTSTLIRTACCAALFAAALSAQVIRTNPGFKSNSVARNDDGSSDITPLGFSINFFGKIRESVYVNNNGNVTFDAALPTFTPFGLQKTSREIIAPFFADVDTRATRSALVTYGQDTVGGRKAFAANYVDVGYYNVHADKLNRFQVVIIDRSDTGDGNFNIEFNYERVLWETGDASGGSNGFGGTPVVVGWSNGTTDPGTSFELPGSMISTVFLDSGSKALIKAHLNTSQIGRLLFQARGGVISPGMTMDGGPLLPDGMVGQPYSYTFSVAGVDGAVKWDLAPDIRMPAGLTFANGQISGQPGEAGTFSFTVTAIASVEGEAVTINKRATVTIGVQKFAITTVCPVAPGTLGQLYSATFSAGGPAAGVWTVDDRNTLPPGLAFSSTGVLSGAPSAAGTYSFTVRVSASDGSSAMPAEKSCMVTISPASVRLASGCALPNGTVGVPYSQMLTMDGGTAPYRFDLIGQLPMGLSLTVDGKISGLPRGADVVPFDVLITDARYNTVRQSCSISVADPAVSVGAVCPLPVATTGSPYSAPLAATGGAGPYTWSVSGTLPRGLAFGPGDAITGTPMSAGPYQFRLLATDATGQQAGIPCSLAVMNGPLGVASCPLPEATVGDQIRVVLRTTGGSEPFVWSLSGALPPGLKLSSAGVVDGKVTAAGDFLFSVGLSDNSMRSMTQPCAMKVRPLALQLAAVNALAAGKLGEPYSAKLSATGGTVPYSFDFIGNLPPGLTGSSDGTVAGTPTMTGTTSFGVRVRDALGTTAQSVSSLAIGLPAVPTVRIAAVPATVAPASANVTIGVDLDRTYMLPINGQVSLSLAADTQNPEANANQPDPHVRWANGQLTSSFLIPAGGRHVDVPLLSTGTVAATMTVSVGGLRAGDLPLTVPVTPQVFRVPASVPSITSACFVKTDSGIQIRVLGSTTTRELVRGQVSAGQVSRITDLSEVSGDYFKDDGTIRFGGAFTLQFDADAALKGSGGPFTVSLSNTTGWSSEVSASRCQ